MRSRRLSRNQCHDWSPEVRLNAKVCPNFWRKNAFLRLLPVLCSHAWSSCIVNGWRNQDIEANFLTPHGEVKVVLCQNPTKDILSLGKGFCVQKVKFRTKIWYEYLGLLRNCFRAQSAFSIAVLTLQIGYITFRIVLLSRWLLLVCLHSAHSLFHFSNHKKVTKSKN